MGKTHPPGFLKIVNAAKAQITEYTVEQVMARTHSGDTGFVLVDCREQSEWAAGHIAGAVYMGKGVIERDAEKTWPDPNTEIIIYCGGGYRSALAAEALQTMGYTDVSSMDGGWRGWNAAGGAISHPTD